MLKRKDLKFRLANRHKEFAITQFAQFMKPTDVVTAVMEQFKTELAADIEKHGEGEIRRYLSHNFWTLNPKNGKMPEKFKELFDTHKQLYLNTYSDSYLRHPRNVVRELDNLYEKCTEQLQNAEPDKARQLVPTMLKIIQTIKTTIDGIPFDLENEEDELEKAQVAMVLNSKMAIPDPLEEEDEQKLKELLDTDAPFEKIRNFIEYLRCKNHHIFAVIPVRDDEKGKQLFLRGRRIEFIGFGHPEPEERQPNTAVVGSIREYID